MVEMKNKKIIEKYKKKIVLIKKFNKQYYDDNKPTISDSEYDELKKEILSLEAKNKFLDADDSPSKVVGYKPSKILKNIFIEFNVSLANAFQKTIC